MGMSFAEAVSKAPGAQLAVRPTPGAEKVHQYIQHHTPVHTSSISSFRPTKNSIHLLIQLKILIESVPFERLAGSNVVHPWSLHFTCTFSRHPYSIESNIQQCFEVSPSELTINIGMSL